MSLVILIVGQNASGKTTLAKKLSDDIGISRIAGDDFLSFIKENVLYYHDLDFSYVNDKYSSLKQLKIDYRNELARILLTLQQSVVLEASGHKKAYRDQYFTPLRQMEDVKTLIIWADLPEQELLKRLQKRETEHTGWLKQYREKGPFEPPEATEADTLLRYDQANYSDILSEVRKLLD